MLGLIPFCRRAGHGRLNPALWGTAYCLLAAIGYTGVNICLRLLANGPDPMWTICLKEAVAVAALGPWMLYRAVRGRALAPSPTHIALLAAVGLAVQLVGNVGVLWALGVVGLAVAIPATNGVTLGMSAVFSALLLRERITGRSVAAIGLLIAAIVLLNLGAEQANAGSGQRFTAVAMALGATCLAGMTYAALSVALRKTLGPALPAPLAVLVVTGMGVVSLGPLSLWRLGPQRIMATSGWDLGLIMLCGTLNLLAFLAISKGFQLTPIVRASVLNASQVAMAAVVGMLFFMEPARWPVVLGVVLTIVSMITINHRTGADKPEVPGV